MRLSPILAAALAVGGCRSAPPAASAAAESPDPDARTRTLLADSWTALDEARDGELLGKEGSAQVRSALEAYRAGDGLKAVLLAQAAVGADPGNVPRRRLLRALAERTAIDPDPQGLLPLAALIQHELSRAQEEFLNDRYGAALQSCRRAVLLDPGNAAAWTKMGSSYYALGDRPRARSAYESALRLDPSDSRLQAFLEGEGWR